MPIRTRENFWILETAHTGYAFGLTTRGMVVHAYWGARLPLVEDYPPPYEPGHRTSFSSPGHFTPEEYPAHAGAKFVEPCLQALFADGVRDVVLHYVGAEVTEDALRITLRDAAYPLEVDLCYRIHQEHDLIERWVEVRNTGDAPIILERVWSALWHLPAGGTYRFSHLSGRWFNEWNLQREPLTAGVKVRESRRLTTSHDANPWFAVDRGAADEEQGEVWFGALAWSGNWKLAAEVTDFDLTRIGVGLNDWDFAWQLNPGETFITPASLAGYTTQGFGAASRLLHDYIRDSLLPHGKRLHPVLYNSWEAVFFDVSEESQMAVAELAAQMGVELFVMDDGWFHRRNDDDAGLGDWRPDATKFPNGIRLLVERVNALGMEFGLWLEPEMVNPDSDLYRAHPDWVYHFPTRERTELRNQLILNLGRVDVQDYLIAALDKLLSEHNITFIKWDMNRNISEPGWPGAPGDGREVWVRHVQGLYRVWGVLAQRHPRILWQSCSGGGGRADLGILRLADQIWVSDNTEASARLRIQHGFSQVFPAMVMEAQVTHMGDPLFPLEFRFHVSMLGSLGVSANLLEWSDKERALGAQLVAQYKEIRPLVQLGDQYRLLWAQGGAFSAVQYVSKEKDEGVLFAFRTHMAEPAPLYPIYLRGLDPAATYTVEGFPGVRSGQAWMHNGLHLKLGNMQSVIRRIRRVAEAANRDTASRSTTPGVV